jgi:DNA-binding HxlR family transcriptional regulator
MNERSVFPAAATGDDHPVQTISAFCPNYHRAVELIGRRWTGAILRVLLSGAIRFSDITAAIPGLSDRLLSERLKELEFEGIVTRTVIPVTPVRIEYRLTEKGHALNDVMLAISAWAEAWLAGPTESTRRDLAADPLVATVDGHH